MLMSVKQLLWAGHRRQDRQWPWDFISDVNACKGKSPHQVRCQMPEGLTNSQQEAMQGLPAPYMGVCWSQECEISLKRQLGGRLQSLEVSIDQRESLKVCEQRRDLGKPALLEFLSGG